MTQIRWYEALGSIVYLGTLALIVAVLSQGQAVLIPIALAGFLAFILTPPVKLLERVHLHRVLAVILVLALTLATVGAFGYLLNRQLGELAAHMPEYSRAIRVKFAALRATHGSLASIQEEIEKVSAELDRQEAARTQSRVHSAAAGAQPVRVIPDEQTDVERLIQTMEPVFEPLATAVIVLVLTGFMLTRREDLRNRFIRLVGQGRMTVTTRAMDEAGQRISQFLLTQTLINVVFGAVITAGLFLIGLPYAALWGFSAALLRFVPFIGVFLATLLPTAVAFVLFEAWTPTVGTLLLFLVVDVVTAQVIEPLVVGHRTGVSSLALLVMALLWTWLWGPIGLLLSTPITVCLAALGRQVPSLEFLSIALGDDPPLAAHAAYYQRLIAGDEDEAGEIVDRQLEDRTPLEVLDDVLVPALAWATSDRAREEITASEQQFVLDVTRAVAAEVTEPKEGAAPPLTGADRDDPRTEVIGVPARGAADEVTLEMLGRLVDAAGGRLTTVSTSMLVAELIARIEQERPAAVCIAVLPPGGLHRARSVCKRLRATVSGLRIIVLRPRADLDEEESAPRLREAGADAVARSLAEAVAEIEPLLGALHQRDEERVAASL